MSDLGFQLKEAINNNFHEYIHAYKRYDYHKAEVLAKTCAALSFAVRHIQSNGIDVRKNRFFKELGVLLSNMSVRYVPRNFRRLKEKILELLEGTEVTDLVDLPRTGNKNSEKYNDKEMLSWLVQLRMSPRNYTDAYIIRKVQTLCSLAEKGVPSYSWFTSKLAEPKMKWLTQDRFGSSRHRDFFEAYTPLKNAIYAGDCWQVDGTRVNFIPYRDEDGKEAFLYIIAVIDVHSGDVLGWHFDTKENRWGYVCALKMAANMAGYLPGELVIDRFPGHNTEEWKAVQGRLTREGVNVTVTSKKTGKAKVERFFGTLQTVFMQESKYYYGEGVQSRRKSAHRAPEYLKQVKKEARQEGWDFQAAWQEAERIIQLYKNTKYSDYSRKFADIDKTPAELHAESDKPMTRQIDPWCFMELFGLEKRLQVAKGGFLKTEIARMPYTYELPDEVRIHHKAVRICYDMEDLGTVYVFEDSDDINRSFLGEAVEVRATQIYGQEGDYKEVAKRQAKAKRLEERRKEEVHALVEAGSDVEILLAGFSSKPDSASAESAWLKDRIGEWDDSADKIRILNQKPLHREEDEGDDLDIESLTINQF